MIAIGKLNTLRVLGRDQTGHILTNGEQQITLPFTNITGPLLEVDEEIEVFVYTNKQGVLTATQKKPFATVEQFVYLKVVAENDNGVFLDLGIEKDLFVPKKEQRWPMPKGKNFVVYIYLDTGNNHMVATTKFNKYINRETQDLNVGDEVELLISEETDLGYNAIINNQYIGLLYFNEVFEDLRTGNKRKGWIKNIYPDGKVDLSLQQQGYQHILITKEVIIDKLKKNKGSLSLGDKSSPEDIYQTFKISKKAFKKAIGALYKERLIHITDNAIKLNEANL